MKKLFFLLSVIIVTTNCTYSHSDKEHTIKKRQTIKNGSWSFQAALSQNIPDSCEGGAVALSSDGSILAAGSPGLNSGNGATQIYARTANNTWIHQATLSQGIVNAIEGASLALSSDGTTCAAGIPGFNNTNGGVEVYAFSQNVWEHQATLSELGTLTKAKRDLSQIPSFVVEGISIASSADGNTIAAGCLFFPIDIGGTVIYIRQFDTLWSAQTLLTQGIAGSWEGTAVSLSADGNTLAAGASGYNYKQGCAQIYVRTGNTWTYQATLSYGLANAEEGHAVALSADGNTLAAGSYSAWNTGAIQIYVRSGSTWSRQATLTQSISNAYEGWSVSLSADGNTLAAGSWNAYDTGVTQMYSRSGTTWTHQTTLSQKKQNGNEGYAIALSADGATLAAGTNSTQDTTFVYVN